MLKYVLDWTELLHSVHVVDYPLAFPKLVKVAIILQFCGFFF